MKLTTYLRENDLTVTALARSVGVDVSTMHRIVHGKHIPGQKTMRAIIRETGGQVQPNDFFDLLGEAA